MSLVGFNGTLASGLTANGNTSVSLPVSRRFRVYTFGTFGGATVYLEASPNGSTWFAVDPSGASADVYFDSFLSRDSQYRIRVSGASGTTNVSVVASPLYEHLGGGASGFGGGSSALGFRVFDEVDTMYVVSRRTVDETGVEYLVPKIVYDENDVAYNVI